jgi:ABC-type sugar transport system ATPase subunit
VPGIAFRGVEKRYDGIHALRGLDLEVADGELLVLVGPSAAGKSTALRLAAGLEEVTAGSISIGSRDVTRVPPAQRNVSMVFQSYALFPHLTVEENIRFGLSARHVPRAKATELVRVAAELAGCDGLFQRKPFQLSGGERQRVALARAIAREPDLFLLDEPLSNLDAQLRVHTRAELKRLHGRLGRTMLYVTHDQVEAMTMGERIGVLAGGRIQQVGTPDEIFRRPTNRFVAGFIGSPAMNFLPARLEGGTVYAGPFQLQAPPTGHRLDARRLELGIRPEHVAVAAEGDGVSAEVEVVEVAGNEAFIHVAAQGHPLIARVPAEQRPDAGDVVRLEAARDRVYLFDAESGERIVGGGE